jgi:hypothetical protein
MRPADALIADVPYGNKKYETDIAIDPRVFAEWTEHYRTVAIFGTPELLISWCVQAQIKPDEWVTWWPTNKVDGRSASRLPREIEAIAIFGETPGASMIFRPRVQDKTCVAINTGRGSGVKSDVARMGDVWRDPAPGMLFNSHLRKHPNEKPLTLMERLVILCSNPGDTVIDPCFGSGTTGHACANTGRNFIGIEKAADYFRSGAERIAAAYEPLAAMERAS